MGGLGLTPTTIDAWPRSTARAPSPALVPSQGARERGPGFRRPLGEGSLVLLPAHGGQQRVVIRTAPANRTLSVSTFWARASSLPRDPIGSSPTDIPSPRQVTKRPSRVTTMNGPTPGRPGTPRRGRRRPAATPLGAPSAGGQGRGRARARDRPPAFSAGRAATGSARRAARSDRRRSSRQPGATPHAPGSLARWRRGHGPCRATSTRAAHRRSDLLRSTRGFALAGRGRSISWSRARSL